MDFELSDEQRMFVKMFADFCAKEVAPLAKETDHAEQPPARQLAAAAAQGFLGALLPERYGGAELDGLSYVLLLEEIAKACVSTALTLNTHAALVCAPILRHGNEEQKERYLPALAAGEMLGGFALTEPAAGSDLEALRLSATRAGDEYVLRGSKLWVTNAGIGQLLLVFGQTPAGVSAFIVETAAPGVRVGYREKTMGLRGCCMHAVYFDRARVPAGNLLGAEGDGLRIAREALDLAGVGLAAISLGAAETALEEGTRFAAQRVQFGGPIAHKGAIQAMIADSATEVEAMRWMAYRAGWLAGQGADLSEPAAAAKLFCSETAMRVANRMLQVHGGYGYMKEYAIERIYRDLRAMEIVGGTSQMQRLAMAKMRFAAHKVKIG